MKLLFLTDHRHHKRFDSVYLLSSWLSSVKGVEVHIASLGTPENQQSLEYEYFQSIHTVRASSQVRFENREHCFSKPITSHKTNDFDCVCLRILPISSDTLAKVKRSFGRSAFVNEIDGILKTESKEYLMEISSLCPPIRFCRSIEHALQFIDEGPSVLKPKYGYGGSNNLLINGEACFDGPTPFMRSELTAILEQKFTAGQSYLAMKFLPRYVAGDKRILVIDGQVVGASLRIPQNNWLCNVSSGGKVIRTEIEQTELDSVDQIAALLKDEGVLMFGVDTLESEHGYRQVTEINTYCPGGFYSINQVLGINEIKHHTIHAFQRILGSL